MAHVNQSMPCRTSDYAMTRCLVHGAYVNAYHVDCEFATHLSSAFGVTSNESIPLSMCHFDKGCKVSVQPHILTCHRFVAKRVMAGQQEQDKDMSSQFVPMSTPGWKELEGVENTQMYLQQSWC